MNWYRFAENPSVIESILGKDISGLCDVQIKEMVFSQDGPRLDVHIDIFEYPKNPPLKWIEDKCNVVTLYLQFIEHFRNSN